MIIWLGFRPVARQWRNHNLEYMCVCIYIYIYICISVAVNVWPYPLSRQTKKGPTVEIQRIH